MSKIHKKTGSVCMICDELSKHNIVFHKTRRQTHSLCLDCAIGYLQPIVKIMMNNLRKNIKKNVHIFKCPGTYHCETRNQCKYKISIKEIILPDCPIIFDILSIMHTLGSDNVYMCPNTECKHTVEADPYYNGNQLICHTGCKISWCRQCLVSPYHEKKSCIEVESENKNTENGKFIWEMKTKGLLKFCPQCKAPTFKNNGCNKMSCGGCHAKWCWLCLMQNIDYDHYNIEMGRSKCSGKLWQGVDENGNAIQE